MRLKARLILEKEGRILLLKQTKGNGGKYTLVGGTVESNEMARAALVRESEEEAGIIIKKQDLELAHVLHKKMTKNSRIVLYFRPLDWEGTLRSREPEKFKKVAWFSVDDLPSNMSETVQHVLKHYRRGSRYSELKMDKA